eukprot:GHVU01015567.1.p1 GENE.GHVU01015567.1~~GHVU01015567.1.p1  ORF type:complete len:111 (-),score=13.45 GHVU01015567.1:420-752(-)
MLLPTNRLLHNQSTVNSFLLTREALLLLLFFGYPILLFSSSTRLQLHFNRKAIVDRYPSHPTDIRLSLNSSKFENVPLINPTWAEVQLEMSTFFNFDEHDSCFSKKQYDI